MSFATVVAALAADDPDLIPMLPAYKRCLCLGVTVGQSCKLCFNIGWLKRCETCGGGGILFKAARAGSEPIKERCGFCLGRGWLGAKPADRDAIITQESGMRAIRTAAEHKLSGSASVLTPEAPVDASHRGTGKTKTKAKPKSKKSVHAAAKPAGRGRGRQPSAESLARLAQLTGQTHETPATSTDATATSLLD